MSPDRAFYFETTPEQEVEIARWTAARVPNPNRHKIPEHLLPDEFLCTITRGETQAIAIARPLKGIYLGTGFLDINIQGDFPFAQYNQRQLGQLCSTGWDKLGVQFQTAHGYTYISNSVTAKEVSMHLSRIKYAHSQDDGWRYLDDMENQTTAELRVAGFTRGVEADLDGAFAIEPIAWDKALVKASAH
jgi:hypothetical protein